MLSAEVHAVRNCTCRPERARSAPASVEQQVKAGKVLRNEKAGPPSTATVEDEHDLADPDITATAAIKSSEIISDQHG